MAGALNLHYYLKLWWRRTAKFAPMYRWTGGEGFLEWRTRLLTGRLLQNTLFSFGEEERNPFFFSDKAVFGIKPSILVRGTPGVAPQDFSLVKKMGHLDRDGRVGGLEMTLGHLDYVSIDHLFVCITLRWMMTWGFKCTCQSLLRVKMKK